LSFRCIYSILTQFVSNTPLSRSERFLKNDILNSVKHSTLVWPKNCFCFHHFWYSPGSRIVQIPKRFRFWKSFFFPGIFSKNTSFPKWKRKNWKKKIFCSGFGIFRISQLFPERFWKRLFPPWIFVVFIRKNFFSKKKKILQKKENSKKILDWNFSKPNLAVEYLIGINLETLRKTSFFLKSTWHPRFSATPFFKVVENCGCWELKINYFKWFFFPFSEKIVTDELLVILNRKKFHEDSDETTWG